jgi:demethylmenaquinone methyltransferase/2-methoxy-6-polyprenyl-1,4-benzoquinol methylase
MDDPQPGAGESGMGEPGPFAPGADRARYVRSMFASIAPRYDLMNTLMTGGRHHAWRRLAARSIVLPSDRVVDVGCGTGDLALACAEVGASTVLGIDFAAPMVERAREKARDQAADARAAPAPGATPSPDAATVSFAVADATALPLADGAVDAWCSAFVVRNIPDLDAALAEAFRVLRPFGRLAILDMPRVDRGLLAPATRLYMRRVVPALGRAVSRHRDAYSYLPESVGRFLSTRELTAALRRAGFRVTEVRLLALGTVALHLAERERSAQP